MKLTIFLLLVSLSLLFLTLPGGLNCPCLTQSRYPPVLFTFPPFYLDDFLIALEVHDWFLSCIELIFSFLVSVSARLALRGSSAVPRAGYNQQEQHNVTCSGGPAFYPFSSFLLALSLRFSHPSLQSNTGLLSLTSTHHLQRARHLAWLNLQCCVPYIAIVWDLALPCLCFCCYELCLEIFLSYVVVIAIIQCRFIV